MLRSLLLGKNVEMHLHVRFHRPNLQYQPFNMFDKTQGTWTQIFLTWLKIVVEEDFFLKIKTD
jgi:hypothetical protein